MTIDLTPADLRSPRLEKAAVESGLEQYFANAGHRWLRPPRWHPDARSAYAYVHQRWADHWRMEFGPPDIYADAAHRLVAGTAAATVLDRVWQTVREVAGPTAGPDRLLPAFWDDVPFTLVELLQRDDSNSPVRKSFKKAVELMPGVYAAGLFLFWVLWDEVVFVPRPSLWSAEGQLHRNDGPAIAWLTGERYWFWRGTQVPQWLIEQPELITPALIRDEFNQEVRRCMLERFGIEHFIRKSGAMVVSEDACGRLWQIDLGDRRPYQIVEVENGTNQSDSTRRHYFLRVPPNIRLAHEAVAWTYGLTAKQYDVAVRT
jgi:hypothetical protein